MAYHAEGSVLPPWEDFAGRRSRRLSLVFNLSTAHLTVKDGGAMRLHRSVTASRSTGATGHGQHEHRAGMVAEVPAGGGNWCVFRTHEFKQEITKVKLPCGRWCIIVCAENIEAPKSSISHTMGQTITKADNFEASLDVICDVCCFAAGDGVVLPCPESHRICRECLHREIRMAAVPSCPCCAGGADRVHVTDKFDLFGSSGVDSMGCICSDEHVDPGARVIIMGQCKSSGLNGKLGEAIWHNRSGMCWEVRIFATGKLVSVENASCTLADACAAGSELSQCPCWPNGRGIYPVSLGNRCCTKLGIDECTGPIECPSGYPYFHGQEYMPFDSILTTLDGILYFLRHDFADFFHWNSCLNVSPKQYPNVVFNNYRSTIHSFPHHHPNKDHHKLYRRVERFRAFCRHSREVRGARTPLFIRYVGSSEEFARVEELYAHLRLWAGSRARLFVVSMLQRDTKSDKAELLRHRTFPRILYYLTGVVTVMDFMPIREACRFAVYDEAGLLDCKLTTTAELLQQVRPFEDPYTTKSSECPESWLIPLAGQNPAFFPECPHAALEGQGRRDNESLRSAVRSGKVESAITLLENAGADPNTFDPAGRTPLHDLCDLAVSGRIAMQPAVRCAAALLLAHGDPLCRDRAGGSALEAFLPPVRGSRTSAGRRAAYASASCKHRGPRELRALLEAAALISDSATPCHTDALHSALEIIGEPKRSNLARILDFGALHAVGEAELAWRNPPPDGETILAEIDEELRMVERLPEVERKKAMKRLLLEWHPDKNAKRLSLATTVFQYLQAHKGAVIGK